MKHMTSRRLFGPVWFHPTNDAGSGSSDKPGDDDDGDDKDEPGDGDGDGGQDDKPPESVEMTQEQLDKLLNRAYAKGARAAKKEAAKDEKSEGSKDEGPSEAEKKAADTLAKATKRLLEGSVKSMASDIGMTSKGAQVAVAMVDFEDCFDEDGDIDDDAVKDVLEDFLKEWPEFAAEKDTPPGYAAGTGSAPLVGDKAPSLRDSQKNLNKHRLIK